MYKGNGGKNMKMFPRWAKWVVMPHLEPSAQIVARRYPEIAVISLYRSEGESVMSNRRLECDHAMSTEWVFTIHVQVRLVWISRAPFPLPLQLATLEAGRCGYQQAENDKGAPADHQVQYWNSKLERAVCFFLVESGRTMTWAITP